MPQSSKRRSQSRALVFEKRNYLLLAVGVVLIVAGFTAMYLEGTYKGFISLNVAPVLIVGGYAEIMYALLWSSGDDQVSDDGSDDE